MSLMHSGQKFTPSAVDAEYGESTVQPNPVDINDFINNKVTTESYSGLKPSLKPLKKSTSKKRDNSRELDLEALEAGHKKIIYIKTFNHVKNEAIVEYPEINSTKNIYNDLGSTWQDMQSLKYGSKKKRRNLPPPTDLTFFRQNQKKFNPLKKIKKKEPAQPAKANENNSADDDLVFLTGLNIQETKKQEEEAEEYEEVEEEEQNNYKPRLLKEWPKNEDTAEESARGTELAKPTRESTLPTLKRSGYTGYDQPHVSVSEARYQRYVNSKPKMYITAKTNSVQAFGRPANYKDHLARVYSKEATPTVQYPLVDHLGPKKDIRKVVLDTYLASYNLEALREIDEDLYEYAKQKGY